MTKEPTKRSDWELSGEGRMTDSQRRMFNAVCGDLAAQVIWHGNRLSKDDFRHLLSGTVLGFRMMPAYDAGTGAPGFIMLGGSSLDLTRSQAKDAITMGLHVGDHPEDQGLKSKPVHWSDVVYLAMGFNPQDMAA